MDEVYRGMGKRVYDLRILRQYTRDELAEKAGVCPKFIYEIENGKRGFSVRVLCKLSIALGVECDYILYGRRKNSYYHAVGETIKLFSPKQLKVINEILLNMYKLM